MKGGQKESAEAPCERCVESGRERAERPSRGLLRARGLRSGKLRRAGQRRSAVSDSAYGTEVNFEMSGEMPRSSGKGLL